MTVQAGERWRVLKFWPSRRSISFMRLPMLKRHIKSLNKTVEALELVRVEPAPVALCHLRDATS